MCRDPLNVEMDQLRAKVERLERVRLQNENLIQHQSLKMDQFAAKVKRLEAERDEALAAIGKKICLMRDPVYECPRCGRRRDTQYGDTCPWCENKRQRAEGMEAAAVIAKDARGWDHLEIERRILTAAKEQT